MKKIIAAAAGLMMVGVMASSASAVESKFGGYWRTRAFSQIDFSDDSGTLSRADTRTRLYYTAVFNENFQFVNKFEYNAVFGDTNGGDIGADGDTFRVKNSYADFKVGGAQFKVGIQGATIARGFMFADDFSGVVAIFPAGDMTIPFAWVKVEDDSVNTLERDYYTVFPVIKVSDTLTLNPYFLYDTVEGEDWNNFYAGMDIDVKTDAFGAWGTGIYQFGEIMDRDVSAFLLAAGANAGPVHGQMFYASGQDDDADIVAFTNPAGRSYYWAEIMGMGTFDNAKPAAAPGDGITNVWAANVGFKQAVAPKLTLGADVWYAALVEDNAAGEDELGLEFDVKVTYQIMDNLNLDLVGAYLLAGDAIGDDDPIEVGAQLSLSF
jgi:hypothetical protein